MATRAEYYVGIDTHKFSHTVSVINYDTDKILTFSFDNTPEHFDSALGRILEVTENEPLIFGLEDVKSFGFMFSEFLDERDYTVHHVNPKTCRLLTTVITQL
ncbi:IS110 family transposase [Erysipelothrix sp. D19-032]